MQAKLFDLQGNEVGIKELPDVFSTKVNERLIRRAFWALFSHSLQPKGRDPFAGERTSAQSWNTGRGVSRVARVKGERHPRAGQAAGVAGVVKGRLAKPPRAEKNLWLHINKKERRLALLSAIAAVSSPELVRLRGHKLPDGMATPILIKDELESVKNTSDLEVLFDRLGIKAEIERVVKRKQKAGKARWRGRSKRIGVGPLIVYSKDNGIAKAARGIPGVDAVQVNNLSVSDLAPGGRPARLCIFSESAITELASKKVMMIAA